MINDLYRNSAYPPNKTLLWCPSDTEKTFLNNLKKYPDNKTLKYYSENPIEYKFNNFGFRTPDDFNDVDEGNVYLGCSYTLGVGLHLEETWSYKLNQKIGGKFWNLSIAGSGIMTSSRLMFAFYKSLNIKNIFHFGPSHFRYEFVNERYLKMINVVDFEENKFFMDYLTSEKQNYLIFETHTRAIKQMADEIGANYYFSDDSEAFLQDPYGNTARDLIHTSGYTQDGIVQHFLDKYENNDQRIIIKDHNFTIPNII